jgi:hypothetical protein
MKRLAILNSYNFNPDTDLKSSVCNFLAGPDNIGNLVYLNFLEKCFKNCDSVATEEIISNPELIKEKYDLLILPFSNMLSEYFATPLADIFYKYNIKILLLSIGVQYPLDTSLESISLSKDAITLLNQATISRTPIGTRGETSRAVLEKYGFNSTAIGCPSVFGCNYESAKNVKFYKERIVGNCTFSGHHKELSSQLLSFIVRNCKGYALQDEFRIIRDIFDIQMEEIPITTCLDSPYSVALKNNLFEYGYYNNGEFTWIQVREFFKKHGFFSVNINEWQNFLKTFSCSIGSRFHGNILAMHSGIPAIFIPCDLRTKELVDYHFLPTIPDSDAFKFLDITKMQEMLNVFHDNSIMNYSTMKRFLETAHILDNWNDANTKTRVGS